MNLGDASAAGEHAAVLDDVLSGLLVVAVFASLMRHLCIRCPCRCRHQRCRVPMRLVVTHWRPLTFNNEDFALDCEK